MELIILRLWGKLLFSWIWRAIFKITIVETCEKFWTHNVSPDSGIKTNTHELFCLAGKKLSTSVEKLTKHFKVDFPQAKDIIYANFYDNDTK